MNRTPDVNSNGQNIGTLWKREIFNLTRTNYSSSANISHGSEMESVLFPTTRHHYVGHFCITVLNTMDKSSHRNERFVWPMAPNVSVYGGQGLCAEPVGSGASGRKLLTQQKCSPPGRGKTEKSMTGIPLSLGDMPWMTWDPLNCISQRFYILPPIPDGDSAFI